MRDLGRLVGRERDSSAIWADPGVLELLPLLALKREAAAVGLAAHRADKREKAAKLLAYAAMLREIARRTGDVETLTKAASAAAQAGRDADEQAVTAAKLEQAACAHLAAELFADPAAISAAEAFVDATDKLRSGPTLTARRRAARAALAAASAMASADVDKALAAAGQLDETAAAIDAAARRPSGGHVEAAALLCVRADFLIGFGLRLKDRNLLARAEADLTALLGRIDPARVPLTWARAEGLRGAALCALGELTGEAARLAEAVKALTAAAEMVDLEHSPLDRARITHTLALALSALAEAAEDHSLAEHALVLFDQAQAAAGGARGLALRTIIAHDRASCIAEQAARRGDAAALCEAEAVFREELAARDAAADPAAWAVSQLALTRVYIAQARLLGGTPAPPDAAVALTEALDVFIERGLKTLAEAAQETLDGLLGRQA